MFHSVYGSVLSSVYCWTPFIVSFFFFFSPPGRRQKIAWHESHILLSTMQGKCCAFFFQKVFLQNWCFYLSESSKECEKHGRRWQNRDFTPRRPKKRSPGPSRGPKGSRCPKWGPKWTKMESKMDQNGVPKSRFFPKNDIQKTTLLCIRVEPFFIKKSTFGGKK